MPVAPPSRITGKERDAETGLDDFGARYYNSSLGRWITPDWSTRPTAVPYATIANPQTLNLYAYVGNNPTTLIDPDGHMGTEFTDGMGAGIHIGAQEPTPQPNTRPPEPSTAQTGPAQAEKQQAQKYDKSKYGPEDPTNPGKPLSENPIVKKAGDEAWMKTQNGKARDGLAEAGFSIEYKDGKISIANRVDSVNSDQKPNELKIHIDEFTIATYHTHGNGALPEPGPGDRNSNTQQPGFVRSKNELYVTIPNSATGTPPLNGYIKLR